MTGKAIRAVSLALVTLLALLPLAFRLTGAAGIPIPSQDLAIVNIVFMFAAFAGIITSAEKKQLGISVLNDKLPFAAKRFLEPVQTALIQCVLTALFLASLSELFMIFAPTDRVWGIPLAVPYAALPLMFLGMIVIDAFRRKKIPATVLGIAAGFVIASGPLAGIVWSLSGGAASLSQGFPLASAVFDAWIGFSGAFLWPLIGFLVLAAAFGAPIFVVLSGIAYVAFSQGGGYVEMIPLENYGILTDKSIAAIPLFTVAGFLLAGGSAGKRLLDIVQTSVGWIRGGPIIAAIVVSTFFTTFTGASGVTILALGGLLTVILTGYGYSRENAESLVTATGSLGLLFPPSLAIIIYGTTNIFSVDVYDLFKGALIPGVLMTVAMMAIGIAKDTGGRRVPFSIRELLLAVRSGAGELLLPVCVAAGYFSGFFSLIETAAFTAVYAFVLEVWVRKDFNLKDAAGIVMKSLPVAGGILVIIGAAKGLAYYLVDGGIPMLLTGLVTSFVHSKYVFLFLLNVLLLVVGCLMDLFSAILVVSPLIMPVAESFGINPVHTGVIFLANLSLGFLTPPVGMNLFIASYTFEKPVLSIVRSILPWLLVQFAVLMLITYVPWFSTVLLK